MKRIKQIFSFLLIAVLSMALVTGCKSTNESGGDTAGETDTKEATDNGSTDENAPNSEKLVLSVGDSKIYLDEMMYFILSLEAEYEYYDQMYMSINGTGFWEMEWQDGKTMRDGIKEYAMQMAEMSDVMYQEAMKGGMTISDDEKKEIDENVKSIMENITEEQFKITGLNEELITKIVEKMFIGGKFQEQLIEGFGISEDAIKLTLNADEYRQYNTQALYISKTTVDEEGNTVDLSKDELKDAEKKMKDALKKVEAGETFEAIAENDDSLNVEDNNFTATDEILTDEYKEAAKALKNDKYSKVVDTDDAYYIIKMVNDNSTESFDQAVADAVSTKEVEMFEAEYNKLKEQYQITVNEDVWGPIVMGKTTIVTTTPEETGTEVEQEVTEIPNETTTDETTTDDTATDDTTAPQE